MNTKVGIIIVLVAILMGIVSVSWVVPNLGKKNFIPVFKKGNRLDNSIIYDTNRDLGPVRNIGIGTTKPTETLDVNGIARANAFKLNGVAITEWAQIPAGGIIMWSGSISNIPSGWALCDGNHNTPDLTDRFVIHADADSNGVNNVGDMGGEHAHTLTIQEMPSHNHTLSIFETGGHFGWVPGRFDSTNHGSINTGNSGGDAPHENRPKYLALAFIMKL